MKNGVKHNSKRGHRTALHEISKTGKKPLILFRGVFIPS